MPGGTTTYLRAAPDDRVLYFKYTNYAEHWDEIVGIFAREAILKESFDKYVESTAGKRGTAEVDKAFLDEIERWRDTLARNIALRNPGLSQRLLNYAIRPIDFTSPTDVARRQLRRLFVALCYPMLYYPQFNRWQQVRRVTR